VGRSFGGAIALSVDVCFVGAQVAHRSSWSILDCCGTCECGVVGPKHRLRLGVGLIGLAGHVDGMIGLKMMCGAAG
jgi:hypothetical protein